MWGRNLLDTAHANAGCLLKGYREGGEQVPAARLWSPAAKTGLLDTIPDAVRWFGGEDWARATLGTPGKPPPSLA